MKFIKMLIHLSIAFCLLAPQLLAEKTIITEADQLPRVAFPFDGNVVELVSDHEALSGFIAKMEAEILRQLDIYDIQDNATVRGYKSNLRTAALLRGEYAEALEMTLQIRDMYEKPADRLTYGLITESLLETYIESGDSLDEAAVATFKQRYEAKVAPLSWDVVQDQIEQANGVYQYISEALVLGGLEAQMQNTVDQNSELTVADVAGLASSAFMMKHLMPVKEVVVEVTGDYIAANRVEKEDIWADRSFDLNGAQGLTPVVVAIWDSGVDAEIFEPLGQMWTNPNEELNGEDDDGNGFVDDIYGPAWDEDSYKTTGNLFPLTEEQLAEYPNDLDFTKGLMDLQSAVDSEEAAKTRQRMASLQREDFTDFAESLGLFGNYTHGTHVAGIAAAGNPAIRLMSARLSLAYKVIPPEPTLEEAVRGANEIREFADYLKKANVRVVNMSFGGNQAMYEYALEANGIGDSPEHRAQVARILFDLAYDSLYEMMESAPEILFIPAAGNSDDDVNFTKDIPSSIDLPNVLVVGAVDQAGDETGFTSYGKNVRVHANGFEVPSYVPGGRVMEFSGTSMSAPNVTNLAAKLLAINPELTPEEVIELIREGIDVTEDGRRYLINPMKSVMLLMQRMAG
ncbi:MAG: S8 family serine peptidase [Puniceicoccaceae bacterium]